MASIRDLVPPEVRTALADLAAAVKPEVTAHGGNDFPDQAENHADGEDREKRGQPRKHSAPRSPVGRRNRNPRIDFNVIVMEHARDRARERFPGFKAARIVDEVHAALAAGRVSAVKPLGLIGGNFPYGLYAWTEDGERIYGVKHGEDCFAVHTTIRRGVPR